MRKLSFISKIVTVIRFTIPPVHVAPLQNGLTVEDLQPDPR